MKRVWPTKYKSLCENCANEFYESNISTLSCVSVFFDLQYLII